MFEQIPRIPRETLNPRAHPQDSQNVVLQAAALPLRLRVRLYPRHHRQLC
jgi:hypothetical protein